jgi:molybdenum cofactor guanylyltransferase
MQITGILLAGGKSSRIGAEKGLLKWKGRYLAEFSLDILSQVFKKVIISSSNPEYLKFGCDIYEDEYKNIGPISGIYTGLKRSSTTYTFFLACDMPFIQAKLIQFICSFYQDSSAVIPVSNTGIEPLCALYSKDCIPVIEEMIQKKEYKLNLIASKINSIKLLKVSDMAEFYQPNSFVNINTIEDLNKYEPHQIT